MECLDQVHRLSLSCPRNLESGLVGMVQPNSDWRSDFLDLAKSQGIQDTKNTKYWTSRAVLGERVWLRRNQLPVPQHHRKAIVVLNTVTASGIPFFIWGLYSLQLWPTVLGVLLVYVGKMWFLDRMVWIYQDMEDSSTEYKGWLY